MEVAEAVPEFADAFPFDRFNRMQREAVPALIDSTENVVASAPTASGKTALAELAICKALSEGGTALFIAPLRALTNEKERDWERFEELGHSVYVVTGERDLNPRRAERADILVMTPEKTDSATRKHDSPRYSFITDVDVCIIDEVHLLDSAKRGSVLEVTIARLRRLCAPRVVALSATMPNVQDVADWLDAPPDCTFEFGDDYRPVDLHADVKTYTHGDNSFADKYRRLYKALDLAEPHIRDGGQSLVFVSSRQDTVQAAKKARDEVAERDIPVGARGDYDFHNDTKQLNNDTLRKSVLDGVAFHHAGLARSDKDLVEKWFKEGKIQLLFSTSTLAWGVNLPARCVVIRDTKLHDPLEGEVDMSPLDVLQMLGRAGRPGYDDVGYGWVVCDRSDADKYRQLLRDGKEIESRLAVGPASGASGTSSEQRSDGDLESHLNAEIAMGTIRDLDDVMSWLETTFYYVRARSKPDAYDFEGLRDHVRETMEGLVEGGFVETDENLGVSATPLGVLTSKYYLRLETAERFHHLAALDHMRTDDVLETVARATEFDSVNARKAERSAINAILADRHVSLDDDGRRKVLAILYAGMRGKTPPDLRSDAWVIRSNALRLLVALREFLQRFDGAHGANLVCRVEARLEHGVSREAVGLTAIDGVGPKWARKLATGGLTSPADVAAAGVDELVSAGMSEGVAERVIKHAAALPTVSIDWGDFPEEIERGTNQPCEVEIENASGGAQAGIRVVVNDIEMSATTTYLGDKTVPIPVFGGTDDEMKFSVHVSYPDLPLDEVVESRTVRAR